MKKFTFKGTPVYRVKDGKMQEAFHIVFSAGASGERCSMLVDKDGSVIEMNQYSETAYHFYNSPKVAIHRWHEHVKWELEHGANYIERGNQHREELLKLAVKHGVDLL